MSSPRRPRFRFNESDESATILQFVQHKLGESPGTPSRNLVSAISAMRPSDDHAGVQDFERLLHGPFSPPKSCRPAPRRFSISPLLAPTTRADISHPQQQRQTCKQWMVEEVTSGAACPITSDMQECAENTQHGADRAAESTFSRLTSFQTPLRTRMIAPAEGESTQSGEYAIRLKGLASGSRLRRYSKQLRRRCER